MSDIDSHIQIIPEMDFTEESTCLVTHTAGLPESENFTSVMDSVSGTSELCASCGKQFADIRILKKHNSFCKMKKNKVQPIERICAYCGKKFTHRSSLYRHEGICRQGTTNQFKCPICFVVFSRLDNYKKHYQNCNSGATKAWSATCKLCHKVFSNTDTIEGHNCIIKKKPLLSTCLYEDCKMTFYRRSQLTCHLRKVHGNQIQEEQQLSFGSMKEFMEWKFCEEQATCSYFTKRSGTRANTDYYYCQLDGSSKPHCKTGAPPRKTNRRNKKGSVKKDRICLAKMKVKIESDGSCNVVYQSTHSHKLNTTNVRPHLLLIDTVRYINEQLSLGVPPRTCFKDIINGTVNNTEDEIDQSEAPGEPILVSGTNTLALTKRIKIRNKKDDAISVMIRVALLSKENPNPIILYKPLGEDKVIGPNQIDKLIDSLDLFILGIQTKEQKSFMLQYSPIVLTINWVDDTNAYGYHLLTLVVPDEFNRGHPVAYFILNQFNKSTLTACLLTIKENCPDILISCIIMPDNIPLTKALQKSFGVDTVYINCLISIYKVFRQYLEDTVDKGLIFEMYSSLCCIIECDDESNVINLLDLFIETYSEAAPGFVSFLKEHCVPKVRLWTMAYRKFPHSNINTTAFNESLHNRIKASDMYNHASRRLDELLNILLDIEDFNFKWNYTEEILGIPHGLGEISVCHSDSLQISDKCVLQVNSNIWNVTTDVNFESAYKVVKCVDNCTVANCFFTCTSSDCNQLCSHMYSCTCENKIPLCSHIHKVHSFCGFKEQVAVVADSSDQESKSLLQQIVQNEELALTPKESVDKIQVHLKQLTEFIQDKQIKQVVLDRIEICLHDLLAECKTLNAQNSADAGQEQTSQDVSELIKNEVLERDDSGRYEIQYEGPALNITNNTCTDKNELAMLEPTPHFDLLMAGRAESSFSPSLHYSYLNQVVIKIGLEELTLLHLKSLDPFLTDEELTLMRVGNRFHDQYMQPCLINSFVLNLQLSFNHIVPIHSDVALALEKNIDIKMFLAKKLLEKVVLIMPMNLSDKYWTCVAVYVEEKEVIYFNPFGEISQKDKSVITNLVNSIMEEVEWNITVPNYNGSVEDDRMSNGVYVCHFAEEIAKQTDLTLLNDTLTYRRHIYQTIVGGCLKREVYDNSLCGKCNSDNCQQSQDEIADLSICCSKCNQWYHNLCIGILDIDVYGSDFVCPT